VSQLLCSQSVINLLKTVRSVKERSDAEAVQRMVEAREASIKVTQSQQAALNSKTKQQTRQRQQQIIKLAQQPPVVSVAEQVYVQLLKRDPATGLPLVGTISVSLLRFRSNRGVSAQREGDAPNGFKAVPLGHPAAPPATKMLDGQQLGVATRGIGPGPGDTGTVNPSLTSDCALTVSYESVPRGATPTPSAAKRKRADGTEASGSKEPEVKIEDVVSALTGLAQGTPAQIPVETIQRVIPVTESVLNLAPVGSSSEPTASCAPEEQRQHVDEDTASLTASGSQVEYVCLLRVHCAPAPIAQALAIDDNSGQRIMPASPATDTGLPSNAKNTRSTRSRLD
jgi:hypothetical protein